MSILMHHFQIRHTQIIDPPSSSQGQFGTAVENIGDIDNDGYDDVAISAPYDNGGVVYVYRGSADGLVLEDYQHHPAIKAPVAV